MNAKLWVCVLMGVLVAHISVLVIVSHLRAGSVPPPKPTSEPTFFTTTTTVTGPDGKKLKETSEFTV